MPTERAQGRAGRAREIPVIDKQCGPGSREKRAPSHAAKASAAGQISTTAPGPGAVAHAPREPARSADRARRPSTKTKAIRRVERHHPLRPVDAAPRTNWRIGSASRNSLATSSIGPSGNPRTAAPRPAQTGQGAVPAQRAVRARLDQMKALCSPEIRHRCGGPQQIVHQHAAARPELHQDDRVGAAQLMPHHSAPQPDQLAEDSG